MNTNPKTPCPPHDFVSKGDGTAICADCKQQVDITETAAARKAMFQNPPLTTKE